MKRMRVTALILALVSVMCYLAGAALAQSPVSVAIATMSPGYVIPDDFSGLSFGAVTELPDHGRVSGLLFSATNTQLVTLFKNSGLHNLRLGGSTVDGIDAAMPSYAAIDNVFGFAQAVGNLDVIYSLRLLNGSPADDAATVRYIWRRYRPLLVCFAIGNEPDIRRYHYPPFGTGTDRAITNYTSYLADWIKFAAAITNVVSGATFAGPDAASRSWAHLFAVDEWNSGIVSLITQHYYVGGSPYVNGGTATISIHETIDNMLSSNWVVAKYPSLYKSALLPVVADGLPWRLTESNDYLKGVANASDAFASALWALDYLHWWAAHGCGGVNFHNTEWLKTDTVYLDAFGNYEANPKAYGIRAFDLGGHGQVKPLTMTNINGLNLTAYAVGTTTNLYVTIINKEHGIGARAAAVTIVPNGLSSGSVAAMFLAAPNGNVEATNGMTLGGAAITNNTLWLGQWTGLNPVTNGQCTVAVPAASAAVVKISA